MILRDLRTAGQAARLQLVTTISSNMYGTEVENLELLWLSLLRTRVVGSQVTVGKGSERMGMVVGICIAPIAFAISVAC